MRLSAFCLIFVVLSVSSCRQQSKAPATAAPATAPAAAARTTAPTQGDYYMTIQGQCADLGAEHASDTHENVHHNACNGSVFQRWTIKPDPTVSNRFLIEWFSNSGKFWTAENFNQSADHVTFDPRRDSAFQRWALNAQSDGGYQIVNDGNGRCVNFNMLRGGVDLLLTDCSALGGVDVGLQGVQ